jgi:hypothetical protein
VIEQRGDSNGGITVELRKPVLVRLPFERLISEHGGDERRYSAVVEDDQVVVLAASPPPGDERDLVVVMGVDPSRDNRGRSAPAHTGDEPADFEYFADALDLDDGGVR